MYLRLVTLLFVFTVASAAVWRGPLPKKPKEFADQEGCYVKEENRVIPFGSTVTPLGVCYRVECQKHAMFYASCGVAGTNDPYCYVTDEDLSKPYPACCPTVVCEDNHLI